MLKSFRCLYKPLMDRPNAIVKQLAKYLEQSSTAPCVKESVPVLSEEPSIEPEVQTIDLPKEDLKDLPPASEHTLVIEQIQPQEQVQPPAQIQPQEHIQPLEHMQPQEHIQPLEHIQQLEQIQPKEQIQPQEHISQLQENIQLQEDIKLQEQSQLQEHDQLPEKYQLINSFQMNIHCHSNVIDKNMAVFNPVIEEEILPEMPEIDITSQYYLLPWV